MTILVYLVGYAASLIFIIASISRAVRYARAPLHLRWELYPVPHEAPARVAHGGSYFESTDWWKEKDSFNLRGELAAMVPEMLFLKGLWEFNRRLWRISFLFHGGLYLLIGSSTLLFAAAAVGIWAPASLIATALPALYRTTSILGAALAFAGAGGLLIRRATDKELKNYTTAADIFNLAFFVLTLALLLAGYVLKPANVSVQDVARGLLTFDTRLNVPPLLGSGMLLAAILTAYIPLTHMSHFIAKYFTYHAVRWDDRRNVKGSSIEAKIAEYLTYRPTWSAAHVGADGSKTWAEIATTNPAAGVGADGREVHK